MRKLAGAVSGAAALLLAAALVAVPAAPASAHNRVVASTPASGQTLTALPSRFSITTDLPMLVIDGSTGGFAFDVVGPDGMHYGDGCIKVVDNVMTTKASIGPGGSYTVQWQLVSADGHTVSDSFPFTWSPPAGSTPSAGHATAQRCGHGGSESTSAPRASAGGSGRGADVPLADVLWIGGGVLVVLLAAGVVIVVLTRRPRRDAEG